MRFVLGVHMPTTSAERHRPRTYRLICLASFQNTHSMNTTPKANGTTNSRSKS